MSIFLYLPVSMASIECSFSAMKTIKTKLRNQLTETNLSNLMKIVEGPNELSDSDLEQIVDIWSSVMCQLPTYTNYRCIPITDVYQFCAIVLHLKCNFHVLTHIIHMCHILLYTLILKNTLPRCESYLYTLIMCHLLLKINNIG